MRGSGLLLAVGMAVAGIVALTGCGADTEPAPTVSSAALDAYARELFDLTNDEREAAGVAPLEWSDCVAQVALERAQPFIEQAELVHDTLVATCHPGAAAGENLARSDLAAPEIVAAWMGSEGHEANLLNPDFTISGIGCVAAEAGVIACSQVFEGPGD